MDKAFAFHAFNAAVGITNAAHATVRAMENVGDTVADGASATKDAGVAFWAGMKYAHSVNVSSGCAAPKLTPEDIAPRSAKRNLRAA